MLGRQRFHYSHLVQRCAHGGLKTTQQDDVIVSSQCGHRFFQCNGSAAVDKRYVRQVDYQYFLFARGDKYARNVACRTETQWPFHVEQDDATFSVSQYVRFFRAEMRCVVGVGKQFRTLCLHIGHPLNKQYRRHHDANCDSGNQIDDHSQHQCDEHDNDARSRCPGRTLGYSASQ